MPLRWYPSDLELDAMRPKLIYLLRYATKQVDP